MSVSNDHIDSKKVVFGLWCDTHPDDCGNVMTYNSENIIVDDNCNELNYVICL